MIPLAISILWLVIGIIVLLGCVWLAFYALKLFMEIPANVEKAVYVIALIICIIGALTLLNGGTLIGPHLLMR